MFLWNKVGGDSL